MTDALTIWLRRRLAGSEECVREMFRRPVRKLVELVLTDIQVAVRILDAAPRADHVPATAG